MATSDLRILPLGAFFQVVRPMFGKEALARVSNDFGSSLSGDGPMEFILNGLEESLCNFRSGGVINAALFVDISDLQIEAAFTGADLTNPFEQFIEVIWSKALIQLKAFVIEYEIL